MPLKHSDNKRSLAAMLNMVKLEASQYFKSSSCYCFKFRYYVYIFSLPRLISDKEITKKSGYLDMMEPYTELMVDKGFNIML